VSTQQRGVPSDIQVPSILNGLEVGEKSLDYSLPPQTTTAFVSTNANGTEPAKHFQVITEPLVQQLAKRSKERVSQDPEMAEIQKQLDETAKDKGLVKLSELKKKAKENGTPDKDKDRDKFKAMQAAFTKEGVNIAADLISNGTLAQK
jgi:carboxyl-terminal processing protease